MKTDGHGPAPAGDPDVLIAGGGPVGLTENVTLTRSDMIKFGN